MILLNKFLSKRLLNKNYHKQRFIKMRWFYYINYQISSINNTKSIISLYNLDLVNYIIYEYFEFDVYIYYFDNNGFFIDEIIINL